MLFEEQISRKPDQYPWTKMFIDAMWNGHWTPNEFTFQSDLHDYKVNLTEEERNVIKNTLSAIAQIEVAVKKFWSKLGDNLPHPSINDLGTGMANIEMIHNRAYEKLLDVLGLEYIFEENLKLDIIKGRVKYLRKYTHKYYENNKKQYVYALILFTLFVENVSLFSQFYVIRWFYANKNVIKDTAKQVGYTTREETLHALVGIKLINTIRSEYPEFFDQELSERVKSEAIEAFNAEAKIVDWILGDYEVKYTDIKKGSLTKDVIKEFIKKRLNDSLIEIGFDPAFEDLNEELLKESEWFEVFTKAMISTDFFANRPTEYIKDDEADAIDFNINDLGDLDLGEDF